MEVEIREYNGELEELEAIRDSITEKLKYYMVVIRKKGDIIKLRNVQPEEIKIINKEENK